MDWLSQIAWLSPVLQLLSFAVLISLGHVFRRQSAWLSVVLSFVSLALALVILVGRISSTLYEYNGRFEWMRIEDYAFIMGYEVTNFTSLLLACVACAGFLVNLFATSFIRSDERGTVFAAYLALLQGAMLGLTIADNVLTFYFCWVLASVGTVLLVGFRYTRDSTKAAAWKVFAVLILSDMILLVVIIGLFFYMPDHAVDFASISNVARSDDGLPLWLPLMMIMAAACKSALFPCHAWAQHTAEAPAPAAVFIQGIAIPVTGAVLLLRIYPLLAGSTVVMESLVWIGGVTAIFAAVVALVRRELHHILAYSSISQLGFTLMALGLGSTTGATFYFLTHLLFGVLLQLTSSYASTASGGSTDIYTMGNTIRKVPLTAFVFGIGVLAMGGIPPFAAFWSRNAVLALAMVGSKLLSLVGITAVFVTALYLSRLFFVIFTGSAQANNAIEPANTGIAETQVDVQHVPLNYTVIIPLALLAAFTVPAGFIGSPWTGWLDSWLAEMPSNPYSGINAMIVSLAASAMGFYLGWLIYVKGSVNLRREAIASRIPWLSEILDKGFYVNTAFLYLVTIPLKGVRWLLQLIEDRVVGTVVNLFEQTFVKNRIIYFLAVLIVLLLAVIVAMGRRNA